MKVDQEKVTTAIAVGRSVAHSEDNAAAEATVRLARRAGPDAVNFFAALSSPKDGRRCRSAYVHRAHCWRSAVTLAAPFHPRPGPTQRSGDRKGPTAAATRGNELTPAWHAARNGGSR